MKYLKTNMLILSLLLLILSNGYAFNSVHFSKNAYVGSKPSLKMMINNNIDSRLAIGAIATAGVTETAYLTWSKLSDNPVSQTLCTGGSSSSCNDVLTGPFSNLPIIDIPLSGIAMVLYGLVAALALTPVLSYNNYNDDDKNELVENEVKGNEEIILAITTGMATFSGYLMWLLAFVLKTQCMYCFVSATLSFGMALIAANNKIVRDATKAFVVSSSSLAVTLLSSSFIFYSTSLLNPDAATASTAPAFQAMQAEEKRQQNKAPPLKKKSSSRAIAVAERIQKVGGKMYGAFWCSHCYNQKNELGIEASKYFEYIECDKEGVDNQFPLCRSKKIKGYPTWELNGEFYPGEKDLGELEKLLTEVESKSNVSF